jgi:hypothetical protein
VNLKKQWTLLDTWVEHIRNDKAREIEFQPPAIPLKEQKCASGLIFSVLNHKQVFDAPNSFNRIERRPLSSLPTQFLPSSHQLFSGAPNESVFNQSI